MKKYKIIFLPLIAILTLLVSCQKYLDIKRTNTDKFIETADDCQRLLDNYAAMNTNYPSDGEASADNYFFGTNIYPGEPDDENLLLYVWSPLAIHQDPGVQWTIPYNKVYRANLVLEALNQDNVKKSANQNMLNTIKGSALFFRAYTLWNMLQLYAKPYGSNAANDLGIPAVTSADLNDNFGRGTVKETYDRIVQDLKDAISLLNPETPVKPTRPGRASAYAMLARVYLSMEDYEQALLNADASLSLNKVLLDYNLLDANSENPFVQFNDEVLFHSLMTTDGGAQLFTDASNPRARVEPALYNSYDNNDLRKTLFFKPNGLTDDDNNFFPDGTYRFTGNYETLNTGNLFNGLTVDEMYLTRSECYARTGNIPLAMQDLNTLLIKRWKKTVPYPAVTAGTADEAIRKILDERRKELVFRGQRWTDLRRINKDPRFKTDLVRKENGTGAVIATLPANDLRYTLLIPVKVINQAQGMKQNER